jgi:hypothetical protein
MVGLSCSVLPKWFFILLIEITFNMLFVVVEALIFIVVVLSPLDQSSDKFCGTYL